MTVLDSSAVLALIFKEPGSDIVKGEGYRGVLSVVNLSETLAVLSDRTIPDLDARTILQSMQFDIAVFDKEQSELAARLRASTRDAGLSLGDRACLALAITHKLPVLTADRIWAKLDLGIEVKLIR